MTDERIMKAGARAGSADRTGHRQAALGAMEAQRDNGEDMTEHLIQKSKDQWTSRPDCSGYLF